MAEYGFMKLAVTDLDLFIVREQRPVPKHAPVHPVKTESVSAVAVKDTVVSESYCSLQSVPQDIPAGMLVIFPLPLPASATDSVNAVYVLTARTFPPHVCFEQSWLSPVVKSIVQALMVMPCVVVDDHQG